MPHFTSKLSDLQRLGPILDVLVVPHRGLLSHFRKHNIEPPQPIKITALVDTGASCSALEVGLAVRLGLSPIDTTRINTPSHQGFLCDRYAIQFLFPEHQHLVSATVVEAPLKGQQINALIGRDVLRSSVFVYQGHEHSFTLSF